MSRRRRGRFGWSFECSCGERRRDHLHSTSLDLRSARSWAYRHAARGHTVRAVVSESFVIEPRTTR